MALNELDFLPKRIAFSHGKRNPHTLTPRKMQSTEQFLNDPLIYLARDPRDVSVSNFYEMKTRNLHEFRLSQQDNLRNMTFSEFLRNPFGSYVTNVAMMNYHASVKNALCPRIIIYYENLNNDECWLSEFEKVAVSLGMYLKKEDFVEVRNRCNFDVLNTEIDKISKEGLNKRWAAAEEGNQNSKKTRKGKVGGYVEEASPADIEFMEENAHFVEQFKEYESKHSWGS
eukprot:CAMPEP_0201543088 /NCGR_PEP_ID=MMETSP0161_2-20130828/72396_1 /ASSEMBLY_ACC=CAM_ASM_000251 /TAXON_ID=180227 /ORGANISM="Neoparamoeba aestuarina, Strain SoJaBio B1-5/56/2" /LENGTH=227 /DNA_ID=CAMNT_0047950809 /DNA_START=532 /DNA_END=1218 /DNA_ORIENTATION=-